MWVLEPDYWYLNTLSWLYARLFTSLPSESSDGTPGPVFLSDVSLWTSGHVWAVTCWVGRGRCRARGAASPWSRCTWEHKANSSATATYNSLFDHAPTHTLFDHTHRYREEKYTPIMVPFSRELQINIGSGIHLLCNNHRLHVKTMPSPK